MEWLWDISIWSSLLTLTVLEIVLGIDNIVFLTLLVGKVPANRAFCPTIRPVGCHGHPYCPA